MAAEDALWRELFTLSRRPDLTLQAQLRGVIAQAVLDQRLVGGSVLPSSRQLAKLLGISRNTVMLAYGLLVEEGYLLVRSHRRHVVNPAALENAARTSRFSAKPYERLPNWRARLLSTPSKHGHVTKPVDWFSYRFPFVYGQFDPTLFPKAEWREATQLTLRSFAIRDWAGDQVEADDPFLIEQIQQRVLPRRGIWAAPEQILVTVGAQQALYLVGALLLNRQTTVGIERPCYPDIRNICREFDPQLLAFSLDEHGLKPAPALAQCDYLFVQPSHQNPTTATMPLARRQELLHIAAECDLVLIEDDYDSELTFIGEATPALKALDRDDRVIYCSSLSKTLAPGLRLGFIVAAADFIAEARALRRLMVRHPPTNNQRAIAFFLSLGHHDAMIRRLVAAYRERAAALAASLATHLSDVSFELPTGGSVIWAEAPAGVPMSEVARRAAEQSLLFDAGATFFDQALPPDNFFRLSYSSIPLERIDPGVQLLAQIVRSVGSHRSTRTHVP